MQASPGIRMTLQIVSRGKNALSSAAAATLALLVIALWMGGPPHFREIVRGFLPLFLLNSFVAFVLGAFVSDRRIRWSLLLGAFAGLLGGVAIAWHVMSRI